MKTSKISSSSIIKYSTHKTPTHHRKHKAAAYVNISNYMKGGHLFYVMFGKTHPLGNFILPIRANSEEDVITYMETCYNNKYRSIFSEVFWNDIKYHAEYSSLQEKKEISLF